ncbi:LysE/ArgO family amino acid transporter [Pseudalkalibacillus salsuginis]|uniref:LysE/ArgO family amino acid transporter n=1 Tax=Pseudalkalibacillus salsuginis TaxID=2910972 RepID=UPI001F24DC36|nr:LysE/ArgO family amino acid transporter [Pseudalkalibacillus salsuginis]MCF6409782.1 LysE/ArgO family amino acid transporter [Pseudalkalibacillus salsuginis]
MSEAIIHGFVLAIGLIIALGAQNIFVFNQGALQPTIIRALPVILTASICDTILIAIAVLGVSLIVLTFQWLQLTILGIGFIFLIYMGWSIWNSRLSRENLLDKMSVKKQITFAISVSLLNPHAILDTVGVIGTNAIRYSGQEKLAFALTCIIVSWLWFFGLAVAGRMVGRVDRKGTWMNRLNKISAIIIWIVALYIGKEFINVYL